MKADCYLIFNRHGVDSVRKNMPVLRNGQYAVRLVVEVPDEVFQPDVRTVNIAIEPPQVIAPSVFVQGATEMQPIASATISGVGDYVPTDSVSADATMNSEQGL